MPSCHKVLIADRSPLYRNGFKLALGEQKFEYTEASTFDELINELLHKDVNSVILDNSILRLEDLYCLRQTIEQKQTPLFLSYSCVTDSLMVKAKSLPITGIVDKASQMEGVRRIISDGITGRVVNRSISFDISNRIDQPVFLEKKMEFLTRKEKKVLSFLVEGLFNKEIAFELGVTESTIKTHVSNILRKLEFENRTSLTIAITSQLNNSDLVQSRALVN